MTSMTEYKRRERQRRAAAGERRIELHLTDDEYRNLQDACRLRNVGGNPYQPGEYLSLLVITDRARLDEALTALKPCQRCGNALPGGCNGVFKGEAACWLTRDFKALNLTDMRIPVATSHDVSPAVKKAGPTICDHCYDRYCGNCVHANGAEGNAK